MLRRSKKVKGLLFNITSAFENVEFEFTNTFEPKGLNLKWTQQNQSVDFSSKETNTWTNTERNSNLWRVDFPPNSESNLQLTLIKSKKDINFEKTLCKYTAEVEMSGKWKKIAEVEIDLGDHINTNVMSTKLMIDLVTKPKYATKAVLLLELKFEFLRSDDVPNYATLPRVRLNTGKTIFNALKESNDDLITLGACKQLDIREILCSDQVYLIINLGLEDTSELFKVAKRLVSKTKLNRHETEIIYISFMQNTEELTQIVRDENLEFPVIRGSQMLEDVINPFITGESVQLLILTIDGEIIEKLTSFQSIKERFEKEVFTQSDNLSITSCASRKRTTRASVKNRTADILMETEYKINVLQEEKDFLTSENEQLKLALTRKMSEYDLQRVKEQENVEAKENLEYKSKILQAERDIRATLNKRGVSGLTGKKLRTRCFSYEDDSICYYDPSTNKMKGHISLKKIESVEKAPRSKQDKEGGIFYISTSERVYEIQAQNDLHREKWMSAVEVLRGVVKDRVARTESI